MKLDFHIEQASLSTAAPVDRMLGRLVSCPCLSDAFPGYMAHHFCSSVPVTDRISCFSKVSLLLHLGSSDPVTDRICLTRGPGKTAERFWV